ncbi:uncharacterized protein GGS22DRAFT_182973 [Annulohypoxylon maeteangense]|uniref:uncharacterized protein n=1 Tax=Annulohypoxylon maeteangense TaxID=1927788 RepID=UPI002008ABAC|nr:uncharacterized protein GGS22DRAFT_182973 [Annulohypoxylon maeteangense]KAI0889628.1 hypothetical protein GGS22DRAFT_182973 [Annulohypoxylon maeteangense]
MDLNVSGGKTSVSNAPPGRSIRTMQQDENARNTRSHLEKLVDNTNPEILERGVNIGYALLNQLKSTMTATEIPEVKDWLKSIDELTQRSIAARATIGVISGPGSGSGKRSLINAVLDEEGLITVNKDPSMPIEFTYNDSADSKKMYRADVEFLNRTELIDVLETLLTNLRYEDEAESAEEKLKAFFPNETKETMIGRSPSKVADSLPIRERLGKVVHLGADSVKSFSNELRLYVDAKPTFHFAEHGKISYAPLVKSIRIYTKADALSTGVKLIDIPNTQESDSNSAQVAAAEEYMKSCAGIWVVVPASPDLETGRDKPLLSKAFKQQLTYDGIQSATTLIVSDTDATRLDKFPGFTEKEFSKLRSGVQDLEISEKRVESPLGKSRTERRASREKANEVDFNKGIWNGYRNQQLNGETENSQSARNRRKLAQGDIDKLKGLLRDTLLQKFKAETEEFNKDHVSDYTKIDPPKIFCTSSKVYGKFRSESANSHIGNRGFMSAEDTEIPQLQQYTKKITEADRVINCQEILNDLARLINSIRLWKLGSESRNALTEDKIQLDELYLRKYLTELVEGFKASTRKFGNTLNLDFEIDIYRGVDAGVIRARRAAPAVATSWGVPKSQGGVTWSTYRAVCRRNGYFEGATGINNFNQDLFRPMSRTIIQRWDNTFQNRVPNTFREFVARNKNELDRFHVALNAQFQKRTDIAKFTALLGQVSTYKRSVHQLSIHWRKQITMVQRDANRQFIPAIRTAMLPAYQICAVEQGPGCLDRMKVVMDRHVMFHRNNMFHYAASIVKNTLRGICRKAIDDIGRTTEDMVTKISKEFQEALLGSNAPNYEDLPIDELIMRINIDAVVHQCDSMFALAFEEPMETDGSDLNPQSGRND